MSNIDLNNIENDVKVLTGTQADTVEPVDLPPSGAARDDVLAERTDALEEAAEKRAAALDVGVADPKVFAPDRELQNLIRTHNMLEISKPVTGFEYGWVYTGQHQYFVTQKKSLGWQVVQGDDPECRHAMIKEDTTRRIGDVILMRIPRALFQQLEADAARRRDRLDETIMTDVEAIAAKYPHLLKVRRDLDQVKVGGRSLSELMEQRASAATAANIGARQVAGQKVDRMVREGTVPGMDVPGRGGA